MTSTHSETSSRPSRRTAEADPRGGSGPRRGVRPPCWRRCDRRARRASCVTPPSIRMLVGTSCPGVSNSAPCRRSARRCWRTARCRPRRTGPPRPRARCRSRPSPAIADGLLDAGVVVGVVDAGEVRAVRRPPGPDRNGTSWSGLLTLSGTQAMSQSPVPKMRLLSAVVVLTPWRVTSTPASFHCWTASSAAAATPLPRGAVVEEGQLERSGRRCSAALAAVERRCAGQRAGDRVARAGDAARARRAWWPACPCRRSAPSAARRGRAPG